MNQRIDFSKLTLREQNSFRIAVILAVVGTIAIPVFYFAAHTNAWQIFVAMAVISVFVIANIVGAELARRGYVNLSTALVIGACCVVVPTVCAMIAGSGYTLSFVIVVISFAIAKQTLSSSSFVYASIAGVITGIATLLLDRFVSWERLSNSNLQIAILILATVPTLIIAYYLVRQTYRFYLKDLPDLPLRIKFFLAFVGITIGSIGIVSFATYRAVVVNTTPEVAAQINLVTFYAVIFVLLIASVLAFYLGRQFTNSLTNLTIVASQIALGDLTARAQVRSRDEIGTLATVLNGMTAQMRDAFNAMEQRVAERTHDLELASEVGRAMTEKVANLPELLSQAVELIRSRFDLYYTQIYMADSSGQNLNLRAGTGHVGEELLRRRHHLPISSGSLNGRVAADRTALIVGDTLKSGTFLPNPLLPLTRSEMAVPLIANGKILGVLDMQSERPDTFRESNLPAFQVLAGQLAIAIQNAALFQQAEEARLEVEAQANRLTSSGWQEFLNAIDRSENIGYVYSQNEVQPFMETEGSVPENTLALPIEIAGANVGEIRLVDEANRQWTTTETQIVRATVARVGQHIENLRLLAQAERYRAEAEQVSRRLTSEGWDEYLKTRHELAAGYIYDKNQVQPFNKNKPNTASQPAISHPIVVHDQPIGELIVDADQRDGTHAAEIVAAVAQQLSEHIENLRLLEQTEQQRADADKLYEIGQKISVAKDRQEIVAAVAENLDLPQINRAILLNYEYSESGQVEIIVVTANWYSGHGVPPRPVGNLYPTNVFTLINNFMDTEPSFVGDTQNDRRIDQNTREAMLGQNIHAFILMPIWNDVRQTGSLLLLSEEVISFTGKELLPYLSIIQQITNALENQGLLEQTEKRADQLESVATLSNTASALLDPEKLLQDVVDLTKEQFGLYHVHIYLTDEAGESLLLASGAGEIGRQMVAEQHFIAVDAEQSLVARAVREKKAIIVNNVENEPGFLPNPLLPDTRSEMAVPMIVGNTILGIFDVQQAQNLGGFSKEDAAIYTTLAAQVAVALQNARLYAEQAATVTQLRELDRLKSAFLATMSHELRTPLNSILGFADVMLEGLDGDLTANMDNDLGLIRKNGQHLLNLINDVLDMAKIESGSMGLNPETFRVHEILDEVTSITSTLASEKNIALFIKEDSDQELEIYADRTRLRQVMINLVNNSIKFTEKGKIWIHAQQLEGAKVLITVHDTGIGIPPDKLEPIFQEFIQVDLSSTRKVGGTGLGLPISRKLVEMHGGRLWAESTGIYGEGSTFYVEMPLEAQITEPIQP
jgi:signal transduction histidine kinase